jgi:hypothetical protein
MAYHSIMDARLPLVNIHFAADPAAAGDSFRAERLPKLLSFYERLMARRRPQFAASGPFLCGALASYADVTLCEFVLYAREETRRCSAEDREEDVRT